MVIHNVDNLLQGSKTLLHIPIECRNSLYNKPEWNFTELEVILLLVFKLRLQKFGESLRDISGAKLTEIWVTTLLYSELWFIYF